jgi:acyl carrier protein
MRKFMSIEEKVKQYIIDTLDVNPSEVVPEAKFIDDLGADSLDIVEMIMALEEEFDLEIADEEAEKLSTVKDVVEFIKNAITH